MSFFYNNAINVNEGNITNAGEVHCDSLKTDHSATGLNIDFGGATGTNKITLQDNLANALHVNAAGVDNYMIFTTTDENEMIKIYKGPVFESCDVNFRINGANSDPGHIAFNKSRHETAGSHTIVNKGDDIGKIEWYGSDGSDWVETASISVGIHKSPGEQDMPSKLTFSTTSDGEGSTSERITISDDEIRFFEDIEFNGSAKIKTVQAGEFLQGNSIEVNAGDSGTSDVAGGNLTLQAGAGNGSGNGGDIIFKTAPSGESGSNLNSHATKMILKQDGKVGVGTSSPGRKVHIDLGASAEGLLLTSSAASGSTVDAFIGITSSNSLASQKGFRINGYDLQNSTDKSRKLIFQGTKGGDGTYDGTAGNIMAITGDGNVGIGHIVPDCPLDVRGTAITSGSFTSSWIGDNGIDNTYSGAANLGIFTSHAIGANQFLVQSDSRIKKDIELVNDTEALDLVNTLECKKYFYKDPRRQTEQKIIGFIAQDVKEVLPSAVKECRDFVADELREIPASNFNGNTLTVDNIVWEESHNGNCRFFVSDDEGTTEEMIDLVCNKDENDNYNGEFTFEKTWNKIIFYGKEITDFQIINKPQIFALHHSAIQELSRQLDAEKAKTATLETKVSTLETQMADLLTRVTALESA